MDPQALLDDVGDRHARRQRAVRILEHDLHVAADRPHLLELAGPAAACPGRRSGPPTRSAAGSRAPASSCRSRIRRPRRASRRLRTAMLTPSTALMWPTTLRSTPRLIGNHTFRFIGLHDDSARPDCSGAALRFGSAASSALGVGMLRRREDAARPVPARRSCPCFITQTRSAILRTMPRSWVMNSIAMPRRVWMSFSSARICACTVTSSAVVGSSAISRSGSVGERHGDHDALALTAGQLMRMSCPAAFRGRECRPASSSSSHARARCRAA